MEQTDERRIIIDLHRAAVGDVSFGQSHVIQRDAFDAVEKKLKTKLPREEVEARSEPAELGILSHRSHHTILVNARRGEGKTTFLLQLLTKLRHEARLGKSRLYSLGILDPTLIETKQNVVVMVLRRIQAAVNDARKRHGGTEEHFAAVQASLNKLAVGLPVLDGIGRATLHGDEWADPEYVMESGLDHAGAATLFEVNLRSFIESAARFLNYDAFVLAIDDVDTSFEKGWPVLEAIRKYFTTSALRVILSGDLDLYAILVRRQQWQQMGDQLIQSELATGGDIRARNIADMVDSLQDQYLIKVAMPENRVDLRPLDHFAEAELLRFTLDADNGVEPTKHTVADVFGWYAGGLLALRSLPDVRQVRRTLLQVPVRSALQALGGALPMLRQQRAGRPPAVGHRELAIDALGHIAQTSLAKYGVRLDEMRRANAGMLSSKVAGWLTRTEQWKTMARFQPQFSDDDRNMVAITVAAVHVEAFRANPAVMVEYWLRIALVREVLDMGAGDDEDFPVKSLVDHLYLGTQEAAMQTVARLNAFESRKGNVISLSVRLSGANVPPGRVKEAQAAFRALYGYEASKTKQNLKEFAILNRKQFAIFLRDEGKREGLIDKLPLPLQGFHRAVSEAGMPKAAIGSSRQDLHRFANSLESLNKVLDADASILLVAASFRVVSGQASEHAAVSVLRLIALVGLLLEALVGEREVAEDLVLVQAILNTANIERAYPTHGSGEVTVESASDTVQTPKGISKRGSKAASAPTSVNNEVDASGDGEDSEFDDADAGVGSAGGSSGVLATALVHWLQHHRKQFNGHAVAPVTLSRMLTRFVYAFGRMSKDLIPLKTRYLGVMMNRSVRVFLHAVGVEALKAADESFPASANSNPVNSGEPFVTLLDSVYRRDGANDPTPALFSPGKDKPELRFFDLMFSCPIWAYFLARTDDWEEKGPRGDANAAIFAHHHRRLSSFLATALPAGTLSEFPTVTLNLDGFSNAAKFDSLFFPLNTIYLQGRIPPRPGTGLPELFKAPSAELPPTAPAVSEE